MITLPLNRFRQKPAISKFDWPHPYSQFSHSVATETYDPPMFFTYFQSDHNRSLGFGLFINTFILFNLVSLRLSSFINK